MATPEEMRKLSEAGKAANRHRATAESHRRAAEHKAKLERIMASKDGIISNFEFMMQEVAKKHGATNLTYKILVIEKYGERELYEPMLNAIVEYFVNQNFSASYKIENQIEYYGDGAGPGDDYVYLTVDWGENA